HGGDANEPGQHDSRSPHPIRTLNGGKPALRRRPQRRSTAVPLGEGISGETDPLVAVVRYRAWGWPVALRGHQVWLTPRPGTVALAIPVPLAARVTGVLTRRRCDPLALIHPAAPEHWVILGSQRPDLALPWPRYVHQSTDPLPLPPTATTRGPVTWAHPPQADALRLCREFEVFAALLTALPDPLT
ncbi:MAG: hypothetical protein ACRDQX_16480, partial [Pseudonocardiaceae bacterium]